VQNCLVLGVTALMLHDVVTQAWCGCIGSKLDLEAGLLRWSGNGIST
jgi:hypothetical protein